MTDLADYRAAYKIAYNAAFAVAKTEDSDIRAAKDKADASASIIASAVKAGDDPAAWFKNDKVRAYPRNVAAITAVRVARQASAAIHKANPGTRSDRCATCGQRIKSVPGGQGPTWVHADSGTVVAPNPPEAA
jgi:hypothetical protein